MKIEFSKQQYEELLLLISLGNWVKGAVAELRDQDDSGSSELKEYIYSKAREFEAEHLIEVLENDQIIESDQFFEEITDMIEEYNNDEFWHELSLRLGQRDYFETITPKEEVQIEKDQWLTSRVDEIYESYEQEFEKHGTDRLRVVK